MRHFNSPAVSTASASSPALADPLSPSEKSVRAQAESAAAAALVQRFNAGDESAFVAIMERYRAKIFHVTLALLRNRGDAEEITQNTFIRAHRGLAKFRGDSSLATWLYRIAINLARNRYWYFFRRRRHATLSLDCPLGVETNTPFAELLAAEAPDPAQESARGEFSSFVAQCMKKLDRPHREILLMRNTLHMAYDDIARSLGISVGTVKSRIARARENLRALLAAQCPEFAGAGAPDDYFLPPHATGLLVSRSA